MENDSHLPPVKNGLSANKLWLPEGSWETVFEYFEQRFTNLTHVQCLKRFRNKQVFNNKGEELTINSTYTAKQFIYFYWELEKEAIIPFNETIIFEDDNILVADKPHFLPVAPSGHYLHETLLVRLRKKLPCDELVLCHRLDRETAGVVLLIKKEKLRAQYHSLFSDRNITKTYHAITAKTGLNFPIKRKTRLVAGEPFFRMKEVEGQANTETFIDLIENRGKEQLLKLVPVSGKKHQLRVHLSSLGMPIINDCFYPELKQNSPSSYHSPLKLLAKSIEFIDPISHHLRFFESRFVL